MAKPRSGVSADSAVNSACVAIFRGRQLYLHPPDNEVLAASYRLLARHRGAPPADCSHHPPDRGRGQGRRRGGDGGFGDVDGGRGAK